MSLTLNRYSVVFFLLLLMQYSCSTTQDTVLSNNNNITPKKVMEAVFDAAKTQDFESLKGLLPPKGKGTCDGDCKALCNPGNEKMKKELGHNYMTGEQFVEWFSAAQTTDVIIEDNKAKVHFLFGKDNIRKETMNMQQINGKWYLQSF